MVKFHTLAAQNEWNDIALKAMFQEGLQPVLQVELACRDEDSTLTQ